MSSSSALLDRSSHTEEYLINLETDIGTLREFAEPLQDEVTVTPLMPVIARIMNLDTDLSGLSENTIRLVKREVEECKRQLSNLSYDYINQIISKPDPSKVFRILNNANKFERALRAASGRKIKMPESPESPDAANDNREITITPALINCLTRYRFSLGTPPITPEGIETVEKLMFGGTLHDVYAFRDLLGCDRGVFDRFMGSVNQLVEQSTHYTTATEKKDFERRATNFPATIGLRGLTKTVVTGTADTAIRLIQEHLLSKHTNGSMPLKGVKENYKMDDELVKAMTEDKNSIFVVRVDRVSHDTFTKDVLHEKWNSLIGRLVILDESENAVRSGTTMVYSLHPRITDALSQFHVKDSGTPANTQMNLRLILENFSAGDIKQLTATVNAKIARLEAEKVHKLDIDTVRKKEWLLASQKDYICLKKFRSFLHFIEQIKTGDPQTLADINTRLSGLSADLSMEYFFKNLKGKGYKCISVPQGGGRRELVHPGKFYLKKCQTALEPFKQSEKYQKEEVPQSKGDHLWERLKKLKADAQIAKGSTGAEHLAAERAGTQRRSPNAAIRGEMPREGIIALAIKAKTNELLHRTEQGGEKLIAKIIEKIDEILGVNLPGMLKATVTQALQRFGIESAAKMLERGRFRDAANRLRAFEGNYRRGLVAIADGALGQLERLRQGLETADLDLAEKMLNDIENGSFQPSLALPELSWTIEDVLIEDDFPGKNYIRITTQPDGQIDFGSLEEHLESRAKALARFPELFELYCGNLLIYFNDPHNPTSQVARPEAKLKLLDLASKYHLTILSDEPYHKQVAKPIKERNGDVSLAEFYEQNRARFPDHVNIYTALSTTKWAMGAGRRTGVLLTNDHSTYEDGKTFTDFVGENIDGFNTMSLHMDHETLSTGLLVKKVCKTLEPATVLECPIGTVDQILAEIFSKPGDAKFNLPIYAILIEARNDLDRLCIRGATPLDYRQYLSDVIKKLKMLRLDKQTQKDSAKRSDAAVRAIQNLSQEFPGLEKRCIKPQGPFYFCIQLDETARDSGLQPFLEALAAARKVDVVPLAKGYVRFAFGGGLEGTPKGYKLLTLAIETDLRILLNYWENFKTTRDKLNQAKDLDPIGKALKQLFPGGEIDLAKTIEEKAPIIEALQEAGTGKRKKLTNRFSATASRYLSSIEPDSPATIVTIRAVKCKTVESFVGSAEFRELFEYLLLRIKSKIPELEQMINEEVIENYGPSQFLDKEGKLRREFKGARKDLFEEIVIQAANLWFDPATIKILALEFDRNVNRSVRSDALHGAESRIGKLLKDFIQAFVSKERETEVKYQPTFQAGYDTISEIQASSTLPGWQQTLIGKAEFAGETVPTDRSPSMVTPGVARVAGFDRGIYRRDGDGKDAPAPEYFRKRFTEFAEVLNPKDYVCKMVQIGPTRLMLVMNRSYSHYLVEELRLFPQCDVSLDGKTPLDDLKNLKPDAISFMGIPTKTIGENYRIGYYMEQTITENPGEAANVIPVSWVDAEDITDYMGYLKKPLLTVTNERVKALGGEPVHGAALTVALKNGLRKTIVFKGDSGTGKSETIIAMIEQIIQGEGGAENVEYVELLAGDMLSLWTGDDEQIYMLGTEQGDFMRLSDISDDYKTRFRDLLEKASKTNVNHPTNPRATIPGLCDSEKNLRPVRVNIVLNIDNFNKAPQGRNFQEEPDPENLLCSVYPRGYRREKGTSGDQPNIYASILFSEQPDRAKLLEKYNEDFDKLLGWDLILRPDGKVENAILSFNDIPGQVFRARQMVKDLFANKEIEIYKVGAEYFVYGEKAKKLEKENKLKPEEILKCDISGIDYDIRQNRFSAKVKVPNGSQPYLLDREIFDQVYNPIASTYCGNPFLDPRGMDETLRRFGKAMKEAGVITGTLYTELARPGEQFSGPARAAQSILEFIQTDSRINERFQRNKGIVSKALADKYQDANKDKPQIFGQEALPQRLEAYNLWLWERQQSDDIHLVDADGKTIPLKTPYFNNMKKESDGEFKPSLITPEIEQHLKAILNNADAANVNVENYEPNLAEYAHIKAADTKEELIYQILLANGIMKLDYPAETLTRHIPEIKIAEKTATIMIKCGMIKIPPDETKRAT